MTKKKLLCVLFSIIFLTLYLNIGWALGTWVHTHVLAKEPVTFFEKTMSGGWNAMGRSDTHSLLEDQFIYTIFWPVVLLLIIGSWIAYGVWLVLWPIFAGGLAKLLGLG